MNKQEFLAFSLDKGLRFSIQSDLYPTPMLVGIRKDYLEFNYHGVYLSFLKSFSGKMILRPLSDYDVEIEQAGEKFVPSAEINKIRRGVVLYKYLNESLPICLDFDTEDYSQTIDLYDGFLIVQKLIEWHFDIAGLIEKGDALDINTVENPYK